MGKCDNCKKEIQYNRFKRYRKQILCYECYDTRLERKAAKKKKREERGKAANVKEDIMGYFPLEPDQEEDKTDGDVKITTHNKEEKD